MKSIRFRVTGTTPLLMNSPKAMRPVEDGAQASRRTPTPEAEAENGAYRSADGSLHFPALAFRSALVAAGTGFKAGKRGLPSVLKGAVFSVGDTVDLVDPASGSKLSTYAVDVRRCCVTSAGRKVGVMRARPRLDAWACTVEFEYDERFVDERTITQTFERAGATVGIGNFSPRWSGPFGRFNVEPA
ncbi:MAG: hypothetical protein HMLKMBBP_01091 [Planctomycetes bacterium]|nr:hypothetical protein [Planctomycetota bacterium]